MAKILGMDYGGKRIGLAIAEEGLAVAVPYSVLENRGEAEIFDALEKIIQEEGVEKIVLGNPLNLSGGETAQTRRIQVFSEMLRKRFALPIVLEDERLTSKSAEQLLKGYAKGAPQDAVAAALLLQMYMEKIARKD